jgi:hypothetical protein
MFGMIELFLIFFGLLILGLVVSGAVFFLIKLGIIFQKASEQPYRDNSEYFIEQGRDVGKD